MMLERSTAVFTARDFRTTVELASTPESSSLGDSYVPLDDRRQSVLRLVKQRLQAFAVLPIGWNQGRGLPSTRAAIDVSIRLSREVLECFDRTAASSPTDSGGILLEWSGDDDDVVVDVDVDGVALLSRFRADDVVEERVITSVMRYVHDTSKAEAGA